MIIATRFGERSMALLLCDRALAIGGLTNINNQFVLDSLFTTNETPSRFNTNKTGEVVDVWDTPYRIELVGRTNFIINSAGKNRKFGDQDDIVFNSVSNDFVKP